MSTVPELGNARIRGIILVLSGATSLRRPCGALPPAALRGFASGGPAGLASGGPPGAPGAGGAQLPPAALRGFASGGPPGAPGAGGAQAPPAGEALLKTKKLVNFSAKLCPKKSKKLSNSI